jgi:hypothetical protein
LIRVDIAKLQFAEHEGRKLQRLVFIAELLDERGALSTAQEGIVDLALKEETLTRLTANGVKARLTLGAPPGQYRVRVVVQEAEGKLAALDRSAEIK